MPKMIVLQQMGQDNNGQFIKWMLHMEVCWLSKEEYVIPFVQLYEHQTMS